MTDNKLAVFGSESVTNCHQLKLEAADGKKYLTDVDEWAGEGKLKDFKNQLNKFKVK